MAFRFVTTPGSPGVDFDDDDDVIRNNFKATVINRAIEIDLTGLVCADFVLWFNCEQGWDHSFTNR